MYSRAANEITEVEIVRHCSGFVSIPTASLLEESRSLYLLGSQINIEACAILGTKICPILRNKNPPRKAVGDWMPLRTLLKVIWADAQERTDRLRFGLAILSDFLRFYVTAIRLIFVLLSAACMHHVM